MMFGDMLIDDRDGLHAYFSIEEIHRVNPYAYQAFIHGLSPVFAVDLTLVNLLTPSGAPAFSHAPDWLRGGVIDEGALMAALERLSKPLIKDFVPLCGPLISALVRAADPQDAALLYLFLLSHIQAARSITQEGMAYMTAELGRLKAERIAASRAGAARGPALEDLVADPRQTALELPAGDPAKGVFSIRRLRRSAVRPLRVRLLAMQRTLFAGEELAFADADGGCLFFLPRDRDWTDEDAADAFCRRMLKALAGGTSGEEDDPPVKPVLDEAGCAGFLLRSGRVRTEGRVLDAGALDAAADKQFLYLAVRGGVMRVPRSGGEPQLLIATAAPVEEISVQDGVILYRCEDASERFTHPVPTDSKEVPACR